MGANVHRPLSRVQIREQKEQWQKDIERYEGKLALLRTYETMGIDDEDTQRLRGEVRKIRITLENKGIL